MAGYLSWNWLKKNPCFWLGIKCLVTKKTGFLVYIQLWPVGNVAWGIYPL